MTSAPGKHAGEDAYVALLRGVNVSGQRRVAMADLRRVLEGAGLADVRTYLQSGNAVFSAPGGEPRGLATLVSKRISSELGEDVPVLVVAASELEQIRDANPFAPAPDADPKTLHVTFLDGAPEPQLLECVTLPARPRERAVLLGRAVYLLLPDGYGTTKLTNTYFEKVFGMAATTRNWRTVTALVEMAQGADDG